MNRRAFLATTAAAAAAATMKAASAETVTPFGQTGAPTLQTPLPLGPLPGPAIRILAWSPAKSPSFRSGLPVSRPSPAPWRLSASQPGSAGPRDRFTSRLGATCCSATFPTTASCASRRMTVTSAYIRQPSMNSNGNTIDREGRLITCEHSGRRVTRTELDGSITIIADKYNGKKLNSPNDAGCRFRWFDLVRRSSLRHRRLL